MKRRRHREGHPRRPDQHSEPGHAPGDGVGHQAGDVENQAAEGVEGIDAHRGTELIGAFNLRQLLKRTNPVRVPQVSHRTRS